jgi:pyruvate ferredoxin oxidoreductase gamma subunit
MHTWPSMFQARFHGRGGQGAVTGAELLSVAAFLEGKFAQAFPSFGSERMGAPVVAFCRISDREIRSREPVVGPDLVVIQDATLLHSVEVFQGLAPDAYILINTAKGFEDLGCAELVEKLPPGHARSVAATELALKHVGRPVPNAALLGGLAALTHAVNIDSICEAIRARFRGSVGEANAAAASAAYSMLAEGAPC